jgi:hypothetical protein
LPQICLTPTGRLAGLVEFTFNLVQVPPKGFRLLSRSIDFRLRAIFDSSNVGGGGLSFLDGGGLAGNESLVHVSPLLFQVCQSHR